MKKITTYEKNQIKKIGEWKKEEPGTISKSFGLVIEPLAWLVNKVVPEKGMRAALDFSNSVGEWCADEGDILRDGKVTSIGELKSKGLKLSDKLADDVHNWAVGLAVVEGAGTGFFGLPGSAVDVPAIITFALRTIHKIGLCFGYKCKSETERKFILGVLSASGANSITEKVAALTALRSIEVTLTKVTWKKMAEKAAENQLSKEAAILSVKQLAKQLGINITKRKALAAIPGIGAFIGGSVNGWYINI
jgi:hypothetical protein